MPTVVAERALVSEVGGFDELQLFGEFHDLCLRLALKGEVVTVRESLCSVRTHAEHYSSDKIADQTGWMRGYEKMASIAVSPSLRAYCARMRAVTFAEARKTAGRQWTIARGSGDFGQSVGILVALPAVVVGCLEGRGPIADSAGALDFVRQLPERDRIPEQFRVSSACRDFPAVELKDHIASSHRAQSMSDRYEWL